MTFLVTRHTYPKSWVPEELKTSEPLTAVISNLTTQESPLSALFIKLASFSTPSCIDGIIEPDDSYEEITELYFNEIKQMIQKHGHMPILIMGVDFFLLPPRLKEITPGPITYCICDMWPPLELLQILPNAAELLSGVLQSDEIVFSSYRVREEFSAAAIKYRGITLTSDYLGDTHLNVVSYRSTDVGFKDEDDCSAVNLEGKERILISVETGLTSIHHLLNEIDALKALIQQDVIDSARVYITKYQNFGTDFPLYVLSVAEQSAIIKQAAERIAELTTNSFKAGKGIEVVACDAEEDCLKDLDRACCLLIADPYVLSSRLLRRYLKTRADLKGLSSSAPARTPRVVLSEHCALVNQLKGAHWPTCNPFSANDMMEKISAVMTLEGGPDMRTTVTMQLLKSFTADRFYSNIGDIVKASKRDEGSSTITNMNTPQEVVEAFLSAPTAGKRIIITEVPEVLGSSQLSAANRLLLPRVVTNWDSSQIELFLTTTIGTKALQDVIGCTEILVDADQGHYRKRKGGTSFHEMPSDISAEDCRLRLQRGCLELMQYYKDRSPGSFITKSVTSLRFHVPNTTRKVFKTALNDLTAQLTVGIVSQEPDLELEVQGNSVCVFVDPKQQRTAIQSGVRELSEDKEAAILCIGPRSLQAAVLGLYPDALTVGVNLDTDAVCPPKFLLNGYTDVIQLLKILQQQPKSPVVSSRLHPRQLKLPDQKVQLVDYTPSAIGVLDDDYGEQASPEYHSPMESPRTEE